MAEFLDADIADGDGGLNCKFIISKQPANAPINQRAIPIEIFKLKEEAIKMKQLKKWIGDSRITHADLKQILDWEYYKERLGKNIQKMITIIAASQDIDNPVPLIAHPQWLSKKIRAKKLGKQQAKLGRFFQRVDPQERAERLKSSVSNSPMSTPGKRSRQKTPVKVVVEEVPKCTEKINKNFGGWLAQQKALWKFKRKKRKEGLFVRHGQSSRRNMDMFLHNANTILKRNNWNILSVRPSKDTEGVYTCWCLISGMFIPIKVVVPRTIYIHSNSRLESRVYKQVRKVLPRNKETMFLYQYKTKESHFQKIFQDMIRYLTDSKIEGIYESQIELGFKLVSSLGTFCKLKSNATQNSDGCWNFEDLVRANDVQSDIVQDLDVVYLGIYAFFKNQVHIILSKKFNLCHVVIKHRSKLVHVGEIEKQLVEEMSRLVDNFQDFEVKIHQTRSIKQLVPKLLGEIKENSKDNFLVAVQGSDATAESVSDLIGDLPSVSLGAIEYPEGEQPTSLDWYKCGVKAICETYASFEEYFNYRLKISTEANCPIGQIPDNWVPFITDLLYSRLLKENNMVSWASPSNGVPDMGLGSVGYEELEGLYDNLQIKIKTEDIVYCPNIVAEVKISDFEVNAIYCHERLKRSDGAISKMMTSSTVRTSEHPGDRMDEQEAKAPARAFMLIYKLVICIFKRLKRRKNLKLKTILEDITRWISDKNSMFFDPQMSILFRKLLEKSFEKLIEALKGHGAKIIDASTSRILIDTQKRTVGAAQSYVEFLFDAIADNPLFSLISFSRAVMWNSLIVKDEYNYAGLELSQNEATVRNKSVLNKTTSGIICSTIYLFLQFLTFLNFD